MVEKYASSIYYSYPEILLYFQSSVLDFAIARFRLNGEFLTIGKPTLPCQLLRNVRFGINLHKKCRTTAAELLNAQMELLSPYLLFKEDNKSFTHALPVFVKMTDEVMENYNYFNAPI
jgi:hypothetical protein